MLKARLYELKSKNKPAKDAMHATKKANEWDRKSILRHASLSMVKDHRTDLNQPGS